MFCKGLVILIAIAMLLATLILVSCQITYANASFLNPVWNSKTFIKSAMNETEGPNIAETSKTVEQYVDFKLSKLDKDSTNEFDLLTIDGCHYITKSGHPMLPFKVVLFKLSSGNIVSEVKVEILKSTFLNGTYKIMPAPKPLILQREENESLVEPDRAVYTSRELYPGRWYTYRVAEGIDPETGNRVKYCIVHVFPLQYSPISGKMILLEKARVFVKYSGSSINTHDSIDFLIVTSSLLKEQAVRLAAYRNATGISTIIRTVEWINSSFEGRDLQEKIRMCINHTVNTFGIDYILIFGDHSQVPARLAYIPDGAYDDNPDVDGVFVETDLYYSDLQYSWDDNGDGLWGDIRYDKIDGIPDLYIGRLPVSNVEEAEVIVNKIINYEGMQILRLLGLNEY